MVLLRLAWVLMIDIPVAFAGVRMVEPPGSLLSVKTAVIRLDDSQEHG
jgi:hypothetical protein